MPLTTPLLATGRLRLRPVSDDDHEELFALHSDPLVMRYWDSPRWRTLDQAYAFVEASEQIAREDTGVRVAAERTSDGAFVGWCSLRRWNPQYASAALGYCFTRDAWGQGYATEAAGELLRWAFDRLDLRRVQAEVDTRNAASARVLEKLGFVREGTLREDCVVDGDVSDTWVFGLLRREWHAHPAVRPS